MKLITVEFGDSVDVSALPKGTTGISISDGTNTVSGGSIFAHSDVSDRKPELPNHTHRVPSTSSGPPVAT